jgi:hypothetical protein
MAAVRCDLFKHKTAPKTYLFANIGVMRGHLDHLGWEHIATGVTPRFTVKSIDEHGYHLERYTN